MTDPDTVSADYTLRPSELAATLAPLVEARQPTILWGAPGCAKSALAQQTAAGAARRYVDVRALPRRVRQPAAVGSPAAHEDPAPWRADLRREAHPVSALPVSDGAVIGLFDGCRVRFGGTLSGCRTAVDASSRCAAPSLRSGPSGDPPPSIRRSASMAVSRAFGHEPIARRGTAMEAGGGCYPLPLPCLPRGSRR